MQCGNQNEAACCVGPHINATDRRCCCHQFLWQVDGAGWSYLLMAMPNQRQAAASSMEQEKTNKCHPQGEERSAEKSLFSFELVVDSVSQLSVECVAPAVGFRLLDFPTVIIYHTSQAKLSNLKTISDNLLSSSQCSEGSKGKQHIKHEAVLG